jgi:hypothetical protein
VDAPQAMARWGLACPACCSPALERISSGWSRTNSEAASKRSGRPASVTDASGTEVFNPAVVEMPAENTALRREQNLSV